METHRAAIAQHVMESAAETFNVPLGSIKVETQWDEVASLDIVELVMQCEEDFGIVIPWDDMEALPTVGDLIDYIVKRAKPLPDAWPPPPSPI